MVVPCFNEARLIEPFVQELLRVESATRILLVDDGSEDGSAELCSRLARRFEPRVQAILLAVNRGKNVALRTAAAQDGADVLLAHDADLPVDQGLLCELIQRFSEAPQSFVYGSRFAAGPVKGMTFLRRWGNALVAWWVSRLLGRRITDVLCGLKALPREALVRMPASNCRWGDLDIFFGAADQDLTFQEAPVGFAARTAGESKMRLFRHGLVFLGLCLKRSWSTRQRGASSQC